MRLTADDITLREERYTAEQLNALTKRVTFESLL